MRKLDAALQGVERLGIDTAPLIYFVEQHPEFAPVVRSVIQRAENGAFGLATSSLTLTEVLTLPFERQAHDLAETYREILLNAPYVHLLPVDVALAEEAARLRAAYRLKTPDAIQVAASIQAGCDAFLTNDGGLKRVQDISVLVLSELEL